MSRSHRFRWIGSTLLSLLAVAAAQGATYVWPGPAPCDSTLDECMSAVPHGAVIEVATDGLVEEEVWIRRQVALVAAPGYRPELKGATIAYLGGELHGFTVHGTVWIHAGLEMESAVIADSFLAPGDGSHGAILTSVSVGGPQPRLEIEIRNNRIEGVGSGIDLCGLYRLDGEVGISIVDNRMLVDGVALCVSPGPRPVDFEMTRNWFETGFGSWIDTPYPPPALVPATLTAKVSANDLQARNGAAFGVETSSPEGPIVLSLVDNVLHQSPYGLGLLDPRPFSLQGVVEANRFISNIFGAWSADGALRVHFVSNVEIDNGP